MKKTLYVHPDESIAYLIDRIENTDADSLLIVADANPALFGDSMNLKILKREVSGFGKNCVIASQNQNIIQAAQTAGFETTSEEISDESQSYISEQSHDELDEEVPIHIVQEQEISNPSDVVTHPDISETESHFQSSEESSYNVDSYHNEDSGHIENRVKMPLNWKFLSASVAVMTLIGMGAYAILSPKLSVIITPKKDPINLEFKTIVDTSLASINKAKASIPGQTIRVEREMSDIFDATGKQDKASKAEGDIVIYNTYNASSQTLIKNTRFKSKDGLIYRLQSQITVPGAKMSGTKVVTPGTVSARVIAEQTGPEYNIDAGEFSIPGFQGTPKFLGFYGKSSKPFSGGGSSNATFATRGDLDKAKLALTEKLSQGEKEYIASQVPKETIYVPESVISNDPELSADAVDAISSKFKVTLKTSYTVIVFSEKDITDLADYNIANKISDSRKQVIDSRVISYSDYTLGQDKTTLSFTVKISELLLGIVDMNDLQKLLAGKDESEIRQILGVNDSIDSAEITFWPLWSSQAPSNPDSIEVTVNES